MSPQLFNVVLALGLALGSGLLFATSIARGYPLRSVMVYSALSGMSIIGALGALGAWMLDMGYHHEWIDALSSITSVFRGTGLVVILTLLAYETTYQPQRDA